ncbi:alpha/beta hydrolase [Lujinxingia vulgaris]|uniref:Alpha/beta hydrolase n=1 Tax=Lujinxingia vulgaris TaxID=2600176 RepID=A0A5C6XL12_9DELT|nr:alpha/beta hydrolase [Lujinxingia vulgaris]TXD38885.1 alpha/beta hydrolase [Lujinxingia vulgaris]
MSGLPLKWAIAGDGTSVAYRDSGGAGVPVVFTNGYATSTYYWDGLVEALGAEVRAITWDLRGHGRSKAARDPQSLTVAGCADDLRRVMDAAGVERAVLVAFSFGCQIVLEAWRLMPERVMGLVPILGPFERPFDTLISPKVGPQLYEVFRRVRPQWAGAMLKAGAWSGRMPGVHFAARLTGVVGRGVRAEAMRPFYETLGGIDAPSWHALGLAAQDHSARDLLETIDVPTLVIAGGRDVFSPGELGREMAAMIPGARLMWLEEATHTGLLGHPEPIAAAVRTYLKAFHTPPAPAVSRERADVVGA